MMTDTKMADLGWPHRSWAGGNHAGTATGLHTGRQALGDGIAEALFDPTEIA